MHVIYGIKEGSSLLYFKVLFTFLANVKHHLLTFIAGGTQKSVRELQTERDSNAGKEAFKN